jgi:hypothetical protein
MHPLCHRGSAPRIVHPEEQQDVRGQILQRSVEIRRRRRGRIVRRALFVDFGSGRRPQNGRERRMTLVPLRASSNLGRQGISLLPTITITAITASFELLF